MVEQGFLPRVGVIDIKHIIGEVLVSVKRIELSQEIYYFKFVFIIQH